MKSYIYFHVDLETLHATSGLYNDSFALTPRQIAGIIINDKNSRRSKLVLWDFKAVPPLAYWFVDGEVICPECIPAGSIGATSLLLKLIENEGAT